MKKTKKVLILGLCAVLLVAASVLGTMAYLTDTAEVKNTFTVGNVAITLDEAKVDVNGVEVTPATRVAENEYKLMPGHEYSKDPTIHVDPKSEDCYLFVKVDNAIAAIEGTEKIADQMANNGWKEVAGETGVYVYTGNKDANAAKEVTKNSSVVVFEKFAIKGEGLDGTELAKYDKKNIVITAYAVQADGFNSNDIATIWAAAK